MQTTIRPKLGLTQAKAAGIRQDLQGNGSINLMEDNELEVVQGGFLALWVAVLVVLVLVVDSFEGELY